MHPWTNTVDTSTSIHVHVQAPIVRSAHPDRPTCVDAGPGDPAEFCDAQTDTRQYNVSLVPTLSTVVYGGRATMVL